MPSTVNWTTRKPPSSTHSHPAVATGTTLTCCPDPVVAPGQELRSLWALYGIRPGSTAERQNVIPTPRDVTVTCRYRGRGRRQFEEVYRLLGLTVDRDVFIGASYSLRGWTKAIAAEINAIRETLQKRTT